MSITSHTGGHYPRVQNKRNGLSEIINKDHKFLSSERNMNKYSIKKETLWSNSIKTEADFVDTSTLSKEVKQIHKQADIFQMKNELMNLELQPPSEEAVVHNWELTSHEIPSTERKPEPHSKTNVIVGTCKEETVNTFWGQSTNEAGGMIKIPLLSMQKFAFVDPVELYLKAMDSGPHEYQSIEQKNQKPNMFNTVNKNEPIDFMERSDDEEPFVIMENEAESSHMSAIDQSAYDMSQDLPKQWKVTARFLEDYEAFDYLCSAAKDGYIDDYHDNTDFSNMSFGASFGRYKIYSISSINECRNTYQLSKLLPEWRKFSCNTSEEVLFIRHQSSDTFLRDEYLLLDPKCQRVKYSLVAYYKNEYGISYTSLDRLCKKKQILDILQKSKPVEEIPPRLFDSERFHNYAVVIRYDKTSLADIRKDGTQWNSVEANTRSQRRTRKAPNNCTLIFDEFHHPIFDLHKIIAVVVDSKGNIASNFFLQYFHPGSISSFEWDIFNTEPPAEEKRRKGAKMSTKEATLVQAVHSRLTSRQTFEKCKELKMDVTVKQVENQRRNVISAQKSHRGRKPQFTSADLADAMSVCTDDTMVTMTMNNGIAEQNSHVVFRKMLVLALTQATTTKEWETHINKCDEMDQLECVTDKLAFIKQNFISVADKGCYLPCSTVLAVDTTFDLCSHLVTLVVMSIRNYRTKSSFKTKFFPVSVMVHYRKTDTPHKEHMQFLQTIIDSIIKENPHLANRVVTCLATDGEHNLSIYKELSICKETAVHLSCDVHLKRNLRDAGLSHESLNAVFGVKKSDGDFDVSYLKAGLLSALDESHFYYKLNKLQRTMPEDQFAQILKRINAVFEKHCLCQKMRAGNISHFFANNSIENINALVKIQIPGRNCPVIVLKKIAEMIEAVGHHKFNDAFRTMRDYNVTPAEDGFYCRRIDLSHKLNGDAKFIRKTEYVVDEKQRIRLECGARACSKETFCIHRRRIFIDLEPHEQQIIADSFVMEATLKDKMLEQKKSTDGRKKMLRLFGELSKTNDTKKYEYLDDENEESDEFTSDSDGSMHEESALNTPSVEYEMPNLIDSCSQSAEVMKKIMSKKGSNTLISRNRVNKYLKMATRAIGTRKTKGNLRKTKAGRKQKRPADDHLDTTSDVLDSSCDQSTEIRTKMNLRQKPAKENCKKVQFQSTARCKKLPTKNGTPVSRKQVENTNVVTDDIIELFPLGAREEWYDLPRNHLTHGTLMSDNDLSTPSIDKFLGPPSAKKIRTMSDFNENIGVIFSPTENISSMVDNAAQGNNFSPNTLTKRGVRRPKKTAQKSTSKQVNDISASTENRPMVDNAADGGNSSPNTLTKRGVGRPKETAQKSTSKQVDDISASTENSFMVYNAADGGNSSPNTLTKRGVGRPKETAQKSTSKQVDDISASTENSFMVYNAADGNNLSHSTLTKRGVGRPKKTARKSTSKQMDDISASTENRPMVDNAADGGNSSPNTLTKRSKGRPGKEATKDTSRQVNDISVFKKKEISSRIHSEVLQEKSLANYSLGNSSPNTLTKRSKGRPGKEATKDTSRQVNDISVFKKKEISSRIHSEVLQEKSLANYSLDWETTILRRRFGNNDKLLDQYKNPISNMNSEQLQRLKVLFPEKYSMVLPLVEVNTTTYTVEGDGPSSIAPTRSERPKKETQSLISKLEDDTSFNDDTVLMRTSSEYEFKRPVGRPKNLVKLVEKNNDITESPRPLTRSNAKRGNISNPSYDYVTARKAGRSS